ncbi:arabinosyltransferase domain-containing protein [Rhodococcus sp. X156]|uniref:arabinosyltransferase domain-containing protein n=1 Tax=Rhodococcus sp. X156 TaxID=2499145 RepID=UPI000FD75B37|nr:arabinosyltransferase domain-containing protein [Rhodococcus sp. X156]
MLAVSTPLLPVNQTTSALTWPQHEAMTGITAPLVDYTPQRLEISVPCPVATDDASTGRTLVSTVSPGAQNSVQLGLFVRNESGNLTVTSLGQPLLTTPLAALRGASCTLRVTSTAASTTVELAGDVRRFPADLRPQLVGLYSELDGPPPPGLSATAEIDTRYISSPSALKLVLMLVGAACTVGALAALYRLERTDGRHHVRVLPSRWWVPRWLDGAVLAVLGTWYLIGANTSDDGYLLSMARAARDSGYMGNYYRWFDVPEAPFGWSYELISLMTHVSTASPWIRLPTLVAGILCWMLISREVLPRLGRQLRSTRAPAWAAAGVFLLFWLPYDNGLRPEPTIALGALLTWCSAERAIATKRLLPAAVALVVAALSLAAGPTGLIGIAVLLAAVRPLYHVLRSKIRDFGALPVLAPMTAAGLAVLFVVFADQTLRSVLESTKVRTDHGGSKHWNDELDRYAALMTNFTADGSFARRLPVALMFVCLAAVFVVLLRRGRIPGAALGPAQRVLGTTAVSLVIMSLTPTKWTHHFGAFASIAACLAAVAVVAVRAPSLHRRRNFGVFLTAVLIALALACTGFNNWWYVSAFGISWNDRAPALAGIPASTVFLALAALTALLTLREHLRSGTRATEAGRGGTRAAGMAPGMLAVVCWLVVIFEVLVFAKAMVVRWPAYSVGKSNLQAISGDTCALASDVLVERNPSSSVLQPVATTATGTAALGASSTGFTPGGVPVSQDPYPLPRQPLRNAEATGLTLDQPAPLPFALDSTVPVLGSYSPIPSQDANLTSSWYGLPARSDDAPLLVVTTAGIADSDASRLVVDYGRRRGNAVEQAGTVSLLDPGFGVGWRNLRLPLSDLPDGVDSVRLRVAVSTAASPAAWVAVTPPRVPQLQTLNERVGSDSPVLMDWVVPLQFPCQRPFRVVDGVAEVPEYRITPDPGLTTITDAWQDRLGGGPLGWIPMVTSPLVLGTYLSDDWSRHWGSLQELVPVQPGAADGDLELGTKTVNGWTYPGPS